MWISLGKWILAKRKILLVLLGISTIVMGFFASKVQLSYEFTKAIPTDNPKYLAYQEFKNTFGEDGNLVVLGVQTDSFFSPAFFSRYQQLQTTLKKIPGVEEIVAVPGGINLVKDSLSEKLVIQPIFSGGTLTGEGLEQAKDVFLNLPFYQGLMYNPKTKAYLMGLRINREVVASKARNEVMFAVRETAEQFEKELGTTIHLSGLPYIRTEVALMIQEEMKFFLVGSILLSALILLLFFRSVSATLLSLGVVLIGVVWSLGTMYLFGFKISLLTALIPPLIVVIGIPNCIYFLNKFHTSFRAYGNVPEALVQMVGKMGIVTLFCNIAAAIGFAVFALTKSEILQEFGIVAGINIMVVFLISLVLIPGVLSYRRPPGEAQMRYLNNVWMAGLLRRLEYWAVHNRTAIYVITAVVLLVSVVGLFRLKSEGYIVDDLPKGDRIYTDLKFFEQNFDGIMPLEIVVDTKKKNGFAGMRALSVFEKMDQLAAWLEQKPEMARPLYLGEGLKFAKQAFYEGDSLNYAMPNSFDGAFVAPYLRPSNTGKADAFSKLLASFMDSTRQKARMSVQMADVGSARLPELLKEAEQKAAEIFDTTQYKVEFTGTSVTFLEGSRFIINGLKESIFWAFLLIALCMLYLFKSFRILVCSLVPNLIPLVVTAGVMGWTGVALKPSTVLVFSVALGIAIDVTIRFLVNFKQELKPGVDEQTTVTDTIHHTGISIIYTSLVLIAGFVIFCFSNFGGTRALGWLTDLTLLAATLTNLILLPALLISTRKRQKV